MKLLPTEDLVYKTKLKEDEVLRRLSNYIELDNALIFKMLGSTKSYRGKIDGQTFNMRRIVRYREHSIIPQITGVVERDIEGTIIRVKMRLSVIGVAILCICFGALAMYLPTLIKELPEMYQPAAGRLMPFVTMIVTYAIALGIFKNESNNSKWDLKTLFEAKIMEE